MQICFALLVSVVLTAVGVNAENLPQCVESCLNDNIQSSGCALDGILCACQTPNFRKNVNECFQSKCGSDKDSIEIGDSTVNSRCSNESTASVPPPFSSGSNTPSVTASETSPPQSTLNATAITSGSTRGTSRPGRPSSATNSTEIPSSAITSVTAPSSSSSQSSSTSTSTEISATAPPSSITLPSVPLVTSSSSTISRNVASGVSSGTIESALPTTASGAERVVNNKLLWVIAALVAMM